MPEIKRYHRILEVSHVGCEAPGAYFVPFAKGENAAGNRKNSSRLFSLCGEWDFAWFPNVERLEIENSTFPACVECADKVPVPGNWQLCRGRGYDVPNYINQDYPYPVDPPFLPDEIPCGLYRKDFTLEKKAYKKYFINFEGVSSCFYLWVNGTFAGYSQVSHSTSVLNITDYLAKGNNRFEVLVVKHCDGSYLEDQDFFRLSGIFREVFLTERDENYIKDIEVKTEISSDLTDAILSVHFVTHGDSEICCSLFDTAGNRIASEIAKDNCVEIFLHNPVLWNPEQPALYRLTTESGEEVISIPVGFKRFEIVNSTVLLNGVKVKAKGINRHDSDPNTGYWVPEDVMLEELYSLKRASVNCIRTSHYPNDPRFLEMCDRLGFMVVDEADLESHGMGYNYGDWYWDYWAHCTDAPEWRAVCVDRAALLYERDKNHVCVIMWSLGNESGCGENHRAMAQYIRSRNKNALIHYENAHLEYEQRVGKDFKDISDVESRMYASIPYLKEYLSDENQKKPFFYCEYVDSMSTGEIGAHWDGVEEHDKYFGGCIWELRDHSVNIGTEEKPAYRYGGDFGDWPNDNICCVDGLVYPDRSPRPGYYDMKKVYEPFSVAYENGVLTVKNKRYYADLSDLYFAWTVEQNGTVVQDGKTDALQIKAGKHAFYALPVTVPTQGTVTLNVYARQIADTPWAKAGYEIGFAQFILREEPVKVPVLTNNELKYTENRTDVFVTCGQVRYRFDKITGSIVEIYLGDKQILDAPFTFKMWRAATYNSRGLLDVWKRARYDAAKQKTYDVAVEQTEEGVVVTAYLSFAAAAMPPAVRASAKWIFKTDGSVTLDFNGDVTQRAPALPRFGLGITLPDTFCQSEYFGLGPMETYADRYGAGRLSLFKTTPAEDYDPYVKPQESSSHYKVTCAAVKTKEGNGLGFYAPAGQSFCFKAIPFDDQTIHETMHHDELPETGKTFVSIDYKITAGNPGTEAQHAQRVFDEKKFSFSVIILPIIS